MRTTRNVVVALVGAAIVMAFGAGVAAGVANAATSVTARTCTGATTPIPAGYAGTGQWAVVENNTGARDIRYGTTTNFTGVPLCAVQMTSATTTSAPQWIFCTQASLYACGQDVLAATTISSDLSALNRAEIAWSIAAADLTKATGRAVAQTHVWCVSDRVERGRSDADILADAKAYFTQHGVTLPAGTTCPDWSHVDPALRVTPKLQVAAATPQVTTGGQASFSVTTNMPALHVTAKGADGAPLAVRLCGGDTGLTLTGDGALQLSGTDRASRTVHLCVTPTSAGVASLTAVADDTLASPLTAIRSTRSSSTCQLMVTTNGALLTGSASVSAVAPAPAPTAAPVVVAAARTAAPVVAQSTPAAPRLTVSKHRVRREGEPRRVRSGAVVDWHITVTNTGDGTAADVTVCDTLARGLAVRRTSPRGRPRYGQMCWILPSLAPGATRTLRISTRVTLDAAATRCQRVVNRATVSGGGQTSSSVVVCRRRRAAVPGGTTG